MAIKAIRRDEREKDDLRVCFVEAKQKKALVMMYSCVAETRVKEDGKDIYLCCEWMDQEPDDLYFEATAESIYDFLSYERDDIEELERIREELYDECMDVEEALESRFRDLYMELAGEVREILKEKDYDTSRIDEVIV